MKTMLLPWKDLSMMNLLKKTKIVAKLTINKITLKDWREIRKKSRQIP